LRQRRQSLLRDKDITFDSKLPLPIAQVEKSYDDTDESEKHASEDFACTSAVRYKVISRQFRQSIEDKQSCND
jgi:hypothetical protein